MASNKAQFMLMYNQAVQQLKKFKISNDNVNKLIGVENEAQIIMKIKRDQLKYKIMIKKLDQTLQKLQQSYLDPDTARKIGTVKQQYKIQKDRRIYILKTINQEQSSNNKTNNKIPHQNSQTQTYIKHNHQYNNRNNRYHNDQSHYKQQQSTTTHTKSKYNQQEITQYDYEIQCKLIKQKNHALQQAQKIMTNVYNIQKQCKQMVDFQGQNLQIISDFVYKTKQNTQHAVKQLKQANQYNKKRKRKIFTISFFIILIVTILLIFLFI